MPTSKFEIAEYDVAVEPWSPIKRRLVVRSPTHGDDSHDEATLLFAENRTETGLLTDVDDSEGVAAWAYFDAEEFDDVLRLLESESTAYLHFGHVSGTGRSRSLYFVSVETTASVPGRAEDGSDDGIAASLPFGVQNGEESLELPVADGARERVRDRARKQN